MGSGVRTICVAAYLTLASFSLHAQEVIVDNLDAGFSVTSVTAWTTGVSSGFYGTDYRWATTVASETATATFTPALPLAGTYDVYTWYVNGNNRPTNARYTIHHASGDSVVLVNQEINGKAWFKLGTWDMPASGGYVRISDQAGDVGQAVMADAVRFVAAGAPPADPYGDRYNGVWVYGWGGTTANPASSMVSAAHSTQIINYCRSYNVNSMFVQVRKVGDALYRSATEPYFSNADPAYADPLADILAKAHDTSNGKQYMEVHAWIIPYRVWNSASDPPTSHVLSEHPNWTGQTNTGATADGSTRYLDPGVPDVTDYLVEVATELVTKYPTLDGIHWDYFRYAGNTWGYNPTAITRFHTLYGGSGLPATTDPTFSNFRRNQIRHMGRKVYAAVKSLRWNIKVSAATITWFPANSDFTQTRPYYDVFQDWPRFMSEGLLDVNVPMNYIRESQYPQTYRDWCTNMVGWKAGRHVVNGPAIYLNTVTDSMTQINYGANISGMNGTCPYVYHQTDSDTGTTNGVFWASALTQTHFNKRRNIPAAAWITTPTQGIVRGTVSRPLTARKYDGVTVSISNGLTTTTTETDGTGFYAFLKVDPFASYQVTLSGIGCAPQTRTCAVTAGTVTTLDFSVKCLDDLDGDGVRNPNEDRDLDDVVDSGETNQRDQDSDDDGWEDGVEVRYGTNPLSNASTPPGGFPYNSAADSDGDRYKDFYEYEHYYDPSLNTSKPPLGDVNGDASVNNVDVTVLRRIVAETYSIEDYDAGTMDLNRDGSVNNVDVTLLRRFVAETVWLLP